MCRHNSFLMCPYELLPAIWHLQMRIKWSSSCTAVFIIEYSGLHHARAWLSSGLDHWEIPTACFLKSAQWMYSRFWQHYCDAMMGVMASQITTIVYSTVNSGSDQRKHQSSAPLAFVQGIHRWPMNSPHKRPVTRKMFPFDDVIMDCFLKIMQWMYSWFW